MFTALSFQVTYSQVHKGVGYSVINRNDSFRYFDYKDFKSLYIHAFVELPLKKGLEWNSSIGFRRDKIIYPYKTLNIPLESFYLNNAIRIKTELKPSWNTRRNIKFSLRFGAGIDKLIQTSHYFSFINPLERQNNGDFKVDVIKDINPPFSPFKPFYYLSGFEFEFETKFFAFTLGCFIENFVRNDKTMNLGISASLGF